MLSHFQDIRATAKRRIKLETFKAKKNPISFLLKWDSFFYYTAAVATGNGI